MTNVLDPRGSGAQDIANLWWFMFWAGSAVFVLVLVLLAVATVRSRRRPADDPDVLHESARGKGVRMIVAGGVILPLVVLVPLSFLTIQTGARLSLPDSDPDLRIEVIGHQFWWEVRYPDDGAVTANEIHIPVGRDVEITMGTADVIHSFWVPNLHGKIDMIPGATTTLRLDAHDPGEYIGICAEFCGIQHALMEFVVVASPVEEFEAWLANEAADATEPAGELAAAGQEAFAATGCAACHAVRGTDATGELGPDLTHFASRRTLGARTAPNDRDHLARWIEDAQDLKPGNLMPPIAMTDAQREALLAYLEGLE